MNGEALGSLRRCTKPSRACFGSDIAKDVRVSGDVAAGRPWIDPIGDPGNAVMSAYLLT